MLLDLVLILLNVPKHLKYHNSCVNHFVMPYFLMLILNLVLTWFKQRGHMLSFSLWDRWEAS